MYIAAVEITGLRGFAQTERVELAVPTGKLGSGITVFVGPNNAGKSTVIEALAALPPLYHTGRDISFTEGKRNKNAGDRVSIKVINTEGGVAALDTINAGGSESSFTNVSLPWLKAQIFVLPSRRTFSPFFGKATEVTRDAYMNV